MTDLGGKTINSPPPGVIQLSNGTVTGDIHPRSGSVLRNVSISGDVVIDQEVDGMELTHCAFRSLQTFWRMSNVAIMACIVSPGDNGPFTGVACGNPGDNFVMTDCLIGPAKEGIHLTDGKTLATGLVVSFNEFRGIHRHAIEIQMQADGGVCESNLLHLWKKNDTNPPETPNDSHICLSWACGPKKINGVVVPGQSQNSRNCQLLNNVIIGDGATQWPIVADAWKHCAIEMMGDGGLVFGTWVKNFGACAYTFTRTWKSQNNVFIGGEKKSWNDETGPQDSQFNWHEPPAVTGDRYFDLNDPAAPPQPAAGPRVTPGPSIAALPTNGAPPVIAPADAHPTMTITDLSGKIAAAGSLAWSWTAQATPVHYQIKATRGTRVFVEGDLGAGASTVGVSGIPDTWEILLTLSANGVVLATSNVQYLASQVPAALAPMDLTALSAAVQQAATAVASAQAELAKLAAAQK